MNPARNLRLEMIKELARMHHPEEVAAQPTSRKFFTDERDIYQNDERVLRGQLDLTDYVLLQSGSIKVARKF